MANIRLPHITEAEARQAALWLLGAILGGCIAAYLGAEMPGWLNPIKAQATVEQADELLYLDPLDPQERDPLKRKILAQDTALASALSNQVTKLPDNCGSDWTNPSEGVFARRCIGLIQNAVYDAIRVMEDDFDRDLRIDPTNEQEKRRVLKAQLSHAKIILAELDRLARRGVPAKVGVRIAIDVINEGDSGGTVADTASLLKDNLALRLTSQSPRTLGVKAAGKAGEVENMAFSNLNLDLNAWKELVLTNGNEANSDDFRFRVTVEGHFLYADKARFWRP